MQDIGGMSKKLSNIFTCRYHCTGVVLTFKIFVFLEQVPMLGTLSVN